MGTSLTGQTQSSTYDALLKITDNGPVGGTAKVITDGLGNDSALKVGTAGIESTGTLAVAGLSTFSGLLALPDGSVGPATPALYFAADTNTGFYRSAADTLGFMGGGTALGTWSPTGLAVTGTITTSNAAGYYAKDAASTDRQVLNITASNVVQVGDVANFGGTLHLLSFGSILTKINATTIVTTSLTGLAVTGTISATGAISAASASFSAALPIASGGTGATTAGAARTSLGLVIGTDVQAFDDDLSALAALSGTNTIYYRSGASTWSAVTVGSGLSFSAGTLSASGGGGTVTSVNVTTANGVSASGGPITGSGSFTFSLGAITPSSVACSGAVSGTTADFTTEYRVGGTRVVSSRQAAVSTWSPSGTYSSDFGSLSTTINQLIARLVAHGLTS